VFSTAAKARGSASPRTRTTTTAPSAISIGAGSSLATTAGKASTNGDGGSSFTTAVQMPALHQAMAPTYHGITQTRSPAEHLLRTETMTARHLRDDGALGQALGDDCRLLLRRPLAPTLDARNYLDPLRTRSRRHIFGVVITVNTMVKTMPAHGSASCPTDALQNVRAEHRFSRGMTRREQGVHQNNSI
jgi:hypothetical protein